jgi:hypothetical protein
MFKDFCHQMGVEAAFALVYHPQSNGAVEKANALICTRESVERQVGRGTTEISMEPQHFRLQSDEIHPLQVVVWGGACNTRGNQVS